MSKIKQIILCVETNKKAGTDLQYIKATIKRFYEDDKKIKQTPIFLGSKTKYNSRTNMKAIQKSIQQFPGESRVIYFIDVDDYDISYESKMLFNNIKKFCDNSGYDLVFFSKDVEDVYLGTQVRDNEKLTKVAEFNRKQLINQVKETNLCEEKQKRHCSNILNVLDKFWKRK